MTTTANRFPNSADPIAVVETPEAGSGPTRVVQVAIGHPADDGRVRAKIGRALVRGGYESHVFCPGAESGLAEDGVMIHHHTISESRIDRVRRQRQLARNAQALKPDVIHVHEPIMLGSCIKERGNARIVWDVHEDYEIVLSTREWIPKPLRRLVWRVWDYRERRLIRHVDLILAATPPVAERYLPLHPNVVVIPNLTEIAISDTAHDWTKPHAVFAGSIFESRGLLQVIEALGRLRREGLSIPMTIAGPIESHEFEKRLLSAIEVHGVSETVKYVGMLPREEVVDLCKQATIGVVAHLPESQGDVAWPVKMFEYMACGLPLVYTTLSAMVQLADGHQIGIAVDPFDVDALTSAFRSLATSPELSAHCADVGRDLIRTRYHWNVVEPVLLERYGALVSHTATLRG
jgi:glycosyltransferase involved in cell wall biosynthesis